MKVHRNKSMWAHQQEDAAPTLKDLSSLAFVLKINKYE